MLGEGEEEGVVWSVVLGWSVASVVAAVVGAPASREGFAAWGIHSRPSSAVREVELVLLGPVSLREY